MKIKNENNERNETIGFLVCFVKSEIRHGCFVVQLRVVCNDIRSQ